MLPLCASNAIEHSEIWFSDGNIILLAGSTGFKVHQGQLARHSDFFAALFSLPTPGDEPTYDGCVYIRLDDSPIDVHHFLQALYDGLYFQERKPINFPTFAAVLRLSSKYAVDNLANHCLSRLESEWPSTLVSWNDRERLVVNCDGVYSPRDIYTHPILVINLCLELGFTSFLPAAFYDLSRYGPSKIAESVLSSSECDEGSWPSVSGDVLLAVLEGRERGQKYVTHYVATELCKRAPSPFCTNAGDDYSRLCHESFYFIMLNILRCVGGLSNGRDADPLFTILQSVEMMSREDFINDQGKFRLGLCGPCKRPF